MKPNTGWFPLNYERVRWAEEDMRVYFLGSTDGKTLIRGYVKVAAGNHVRVTSASRGIDTWLSIDDIFVPRGDRHGVGYVSHALYVQRRFNREVAETRAECIEENGIMTAETEKAERILAVRVLQQKPKP